MRVSDGGESLLDHRRARSVARAYLSTCLLAQSCADVQAAVSFQLQLSQWVKSCIANASGSKEPTRPSNASNLTDQMTNSTTHCLPHSGTACYDYVLLFMHARVATDSIVKSRRDVGDSNALILAPADIVEEDSDVSPIQAPKMSKSQLRKQKKVHEEVQKRQQRAQVCSFHRPNEFACISLHSSPRLHDPLLSKLAGSLPQWLDCSCRCMLPCSSMRCQTLSMRSSCQHTCLANLRQSVSSCDVLCITSEQA